MKDDNKKSIKVAWWSAGITSAVACKMALNLYDNLELYYADTGSAHEDNLRFKAQCEKWYGKKIHTIKSDKFTSAFDVCKKRKAFVVNLNAPCTYELKKVPRFKLEDTENIANQVFGFEWSKHELTRSKRFLEQYPYTNPLYPLQEKQLTKANCRKILEDTGIDIPVMYSLGFHNNNCIGCVKGGKGYWNKIREHFPSTFWDFAKLEREIGYSIIKDCYLDELNPGDGYYPNEIEPECDMFCALEAMNI